MEEGLIVHQGSLTARSDIEVSYQKFMATREAIKKVLKPHSDYGWVTARSQEEAEEQKKNGMKPSLLLPGAEKINFLAGARPQFTIVSETVTTDIIRYVIKCELFSKETGQPLGEAIRSINSKEAKWSNLWLTKEKIKADPDFQGIDINSLQSKVAYGGAVQYNIGAAITKLGNDFVLLAMGNKRAYVAATRIAWALSDLYTDDLGDMPSMLYTDRWASDEGSPKAPDDGGKKERLKRKTRADKTETPESLWAKYLEWLAKKKVAPQGVEYATQLMVEEFGDAWPASDPDRFGEFLAVDLRKELEQENWLPQRRVDDQEG